MFRRVIGGTVITGAAYYAAYAGILPWKHRPEASADDRMSPLPGDALVHSPTYTETSAIVINAPPSEIWLWLVQMGYGRAGLYAYDRLDRPTAERILPQFQNLAVGATLPTHPEGGFRVVAVEHECALILYADSAVAREQAGWPLGRHVPEFMVSWAFLLEPLPDHRTRLIARYRASVPRATKGNRLLRPLTGLGIFRLQQRQLLGIKARAEHAGRAH